MDWSRFDGARPVALVTGAGRRVGLAIAERLAARGLDVVLHGRREGELSARADRVAASFGVRARAAVCDLTDAAATERWASELLAVLPRLDVLVHNASVYERSPIEAVNAAGAALQLMINAVSPLVLSARLAPMLSRGGLAGGGAIVALADIHAMGRPRRDHAAYAMSKAALIEMVRSLAVDLAPRVRVNAVAPGVVAWPEHGPEADEAMQARYLSRVPMGRAGTPDDAAAAVAWLALDAAYITGEVLRVDGGRWLS